MCKVFHIIHLGGVYMYKNRSKYDYGSIIMRDIYLPASAATPKVTLHHHKPISEEEMQSLENSAITNMKFGKLPTLQNE